MLVTGGLVLAFLFINWRWAIGLGIIGTLAHVAPKL